MIEGVAAEAVAEVYRAREIHGKQHGLPSFDAGDGRGQDVWEHVGRVLEDDAREMLDDEPSWAAILAEEVGEALQAEDPGHLRGELIQVAAMALAWVDRLDNGGLEEGF